VFESDLKGYITAFEIQGTDFQPHLCN
jgi:hypothetical protein